LRSIFIFISGSEEILLAFFDFGCLLHVRILMFNLIGSRSILSRRLSMVLFYVGLRLEFLVVIVVKKGHGILFFCNKLTG